MVTLTEGVISENSNMGLISKISARMKATNKTKHTQGSVRKIYLHLMSKKIKRNSNEIFSLHEDKLYLA